MLSVYFTLVRLIRALRESWSDPDFRNVFLLLTLLILSGTAFYSFVEGWGLIDSLYFSVITLATVGYGDFAPQTVAGKLFTVIYILIGIGLFVAVARYLALGLASSRRKKVPAREAASAKGNASHKEKSSLRQP